MMQTALLDDGLAARCAALFSELDAMDLATRVAAINDIREALSAHSPFSAEPVDFVRWVPASTVTANDYNPNSVAPPEMKLLEHSIREDGYTQPIVSWEREDKMREVVDGFHRHRVGKESKAVAKRVHGYLPVVTINDGRLDKTDRIASTIRHNRARGKHKVEAMSDIVVELKRRNWSDEKIGRELGMDADEVLRLCQITGLAEAFKDQAFSEAWEAAREDDAGSEILSDAMEGGGPEGDRILHTWDKWECYKHGFYAERCPNGMTQEDGESAYFEFLADLGRFEAALVEVTGRWKHSCEHYLTNDRMNRVAWLGQASVAQAMGIPSLCRGGFRRLSESQQYAANMMAVKHLSNWLTANGRNQVMLGEALGRTEAELY